MEVFEKISSIVAIICYALLVALSSIHLNGYMGTACIVGSTVLLIYVLFWTIKNWKHDETKLNG